jgi:histone H3/H4
MPSLWGGTTTSASAVPPEPPIVARKAPGKQTSGPRVQHTKPTKRAFRNVFAPSHGRVYKPRRTAPAAPPPAGPQNARTRLQSRRNERARRLHPGSMFPALTSLTSTARALREIRYYQSAAMAEALLIPFQPFVRLVREITADMRTIPTVFGDYRWEKDALVCLQTFAEHILVMIFEMTYGSSFYIANYQ